MSNGESISDDSSASSDGGGACILKPLDWIICAIIYTLPQHFKSVDKLFKHAVSVDCLKMADTSNNNSMELLIRQLFKLGKSVLKELFAPVCNIVAKSLIMQSANESLTRTAKCIYRTALETSASSPQYRRKLVHLLVELVATCSSGDVTRDNVLDLLVEMCCDERRRDTCMPLLAAHAVDIRGLLDYIEYLSLSQIRKLYLIVCSIAYAPLSASQQLQQQQQQQQQQQFMSSQSSCAPTSSMSVVRSSLAAATSSSNDTSTLNNTGSNSSSNMQDHLFVLINKQLSSNELRSKQIGVIGALSMITCMATQQPRVARKPAKKGNDEDADDDGDEFQSCETTPTSSSSTNSSSSSSQSRLCAEIRQIWQMIVESSRSSPESLGLFEDNLTSLLHRDAMPPSVEALLKENVRSMTARLFELDADYQAKLGGGAGKLAKFKIGKKESNRLLFFFKFFSKNSSKH